VSDRPILVVLDTSAVVAYAAASVDVGEVMAEVADDQGGVGVPVLCLVEAASAGADAGLLGMLERNPTTALLVDGPSEWRALAAVHGLVGGLAAASVR
jgi:hypothetical protein